MLHDAFREDICAHPEEDGPRLIYADWLEDQGGVDDLALAEYIRVQCALAHTPDEATLRERQARLYRAHGGAWLRALPRVQGVEWGPFERGFVESVVVRSAGAFLGHAGTLFAAVPLLRARFVRPTRDEVESLLASRHLRWLRELDLMPGPTGLPVEALVKCPHLAHLSRLVLCGVGLEDADARRLAGATNMPRLVELDLSCNRIGSAGAAALAEADGWPHLKVLDLRGNRLGDAGALRRRFGGAVRV